uniref:Uncharacterized protein n=1 Tax=Pithovirus LCPAC404 TaxID=2506597 RepID=A0A481ZC90_9VIRU|nr:MAG: hypothetical protein LCPAC404_02280 [Pithovirus LCPAC404]
MQISVDLNKHPNKISSIVDKYLNKASADNRSKATYLFLSLCNHENAATLSTSVLGWYKNRLSQLKTDDLDPISGFICFCGALLFCKTVKGKLEHIEELFRYSTLYLALDHYLDDLSVSMVGKRKLIKVLSNIIIDKNILENHSDPDPRLVDLIEGFKIILKCSPDSLTSLRKIYDEEIKTFRLQELQYLTREEYLSCSLAKGGYTVNAIESLIGLVPTDDGYNLGSCIQLEDDIRDVLVDMKEKINTIATYDYRVNGNLDDLALDVVSRIDALNEKYWVFKSILMIGIVHTIVTNSYFSDNLRDELEIYLPIDKYMTFEIIIFLLRSFLDSN